MPNQTGQPQNPFDIFWDEFDGRQGVAYHERLPKSSKNFPKGTPGPGVGLK